MKTIISTKSLLFPAIVLLSLVLTTPSHGIDAAVPKPNAPVQPTLKAGPGVLKGVTSSSGCILTSVSPAAAEVGQEVVVTGQDLSVNCSVYFQNPKGGAYTTGNQIIDPSHMKVIVPVMASGTGTITVRDRNSGAIASMNPTGHVVPFEVKPSVPVLQSVSPASSMPGSVITLTGSNLKQGEPYMAHFISGTGKRVTAPLNWLSATAFRVTVPDVEKSYGTMEYNQPKDTFYVTRGTTPSNKLSFKVLPASKCVVKSVYPSIGNAGEHVWLSGDYLTTDCDVTFYSATGQAYPCANKYQKPSSLEVVIPNMPGGKGTVSTKPKGAAQPSATIPYEVRAAMPLLATRADVQYLQGIGQKIMGPEVSKVYKASGPTSAPAQYPYEITGNWFVCKNGDVYTYGYTAWIYEFTQTVRVLDRLRLIWPDLDNPALKYGTVSTASKLFPEDAKKVVTTSEHRQEIDYWTHRNGLSTKTISVYLQSKKPPVQGSVEVFDTYGQACIMYDAYVPAP